MRNKFLILLFSLLVVFPLFADQEYTCDFLASAIDVNDNTTAIDGTDFNSQLGSVKGKEPYGCITVMFTPASGAAVSIDFEFKVSTDSGNTWSTGLAGDSFLRIQVNTNVNAVSGVVVHTELVQLHGITHIKLNRVVVGNGAGNCTDIQATLSIGAVK